MEDIISMDEHSKMMKRVSNSELSTTQKIMMAMKYIPKKYFLMHRISSWPLQIYELLENKKKQRLKQIRTVWGRTTNL
jgi:hypothetical protein